MWRQGVGPGLPGLRVIPVREVVVDDPFFPDLNIGFSQYGSRAQEKPPGDYEPDSPEKQRYPLVVRILQKSVFLNDRPKIVRVLFSSPITDMSLHVKVKVAGCQ